MFTVNKCQTPYATPVAARGSVRRGERGSALIASLLVCTVLLAVVAVAFRSSDTANRMVTVQESNAQSLAAAEYGANRAITEMSASFKVDDDSKEDWVYGNGGDRLYVSPTSVKSKDHRRFAGVFGDQEYRVMVRSAALAKQEGTKGDNWLWKPDDGEKLYEVIATARPLNMVNQSAQRRSTATLQTVVSAKYQDDWDNGRNFGALFTSDPKNFQPYLNENIILSGEDHNITKYYSEPFETETIVTPLKLTATEANFMLADGGYWRAGQLTLNYRMDPDGPIANPHRPRTRDFGSGTVNQSMFVADVNKEYDTYLLGGKTPSTSSGPGKTVTVNMNKTINGVVGEINETTNAQTNEGGSFNLVLGKFEDLRNLYINMAGVTGSFTDPNQWWQIYVGQYTHSARNSNYNSSGLKSYPNYGSSRIRAQTAHLMKNKQGQVLVRLFKASNGKLYKYPESNTTWTGYYCWADVDVKKSPGVTLTKTVTATTTTPGEKKSAQTVARTFFWQELVGYQLVRRSEHRVKVDPLNRDEPITGTDPYPNEPAVFTQRDLPASGQIIDKRTIYRKDVDGNRLPAGFDEIYQAHKDAGVSGNTTDSKHPLYGTKYTAITPGYLQDRFDTIYVWEDGDIVAKPDMESFLFEKDFGNDSDGNPIIRQALALHIGYEDQRETTADFDYCDMVFTIYISPAVERQVDAGSMFNLLTDQWWEQNPDNGLTGLPSHPGLVTNSDPAAALESDPFKYNFDVLGYTPRTSDGPPPVVGYEEQIFTMHKENAGDDDFFMRAKFAADNTGRLVLVPAKDENNTEILGPYYYTDDDVYNYLVHEWKRGTKDTVLLVLAGDFELGRSEFLSSIPSRFVMKETPLRWDPPEVENVKLTEVEEESAYSVMKTVQSIRQIAADIFGYAYQNVPAVDTYQYNPVNYGGGNYAEPVSTQLGYLAGEMVQDSGEEELTPKPGEYIAVRTDRLTDQPDGTQTPTRVFLANNADDSVAMAYRDYYVTISNLDEKNEMQTIYGIKDERYSLGFHRSGPESEYAPRFSQDRYEVVLMGQLGFNPYRETTDGKYVAKNSEINPSGPDTPIYNFGFKYGNNGLVPDFVFDKPIDGAGILLVNGNLIVADEFAYYGLLIVTGDLIVRPTYKANRFVYGADGDPIDAYGNSLYKNQSGEWEYVWVDPNDATNMKTSIYVLNDLGERKKDDDGNFIPVAPLYATGADAYRGRLITQGNVLVGGRVLTESVENQFAPGEYIHGKIHCYASQTANDLTQELGGVKKDLVEVVSWSSNSNANFQEEAEKLWTGKD